MGQLAQQASSKPPTQATRIACRHRPSGIAALALGLLLAGCTSLPTLPTRQTPLPAAYTVVREQLVVHCDFPLPAHHRLLDDLCARRGDVAERLSLPISDEPIHIYLFETADRFESFMRERHPEFPQRRAFFLETDTRLQVYAQWGDRVAEDLRHEVTHGYLHSAVPRIPLWLDEGLAEFFEAPRGQRGVNPSHLKTLRVRLNQEAWTPDLAALESLKPTSDMSAEEYATAWAWVHFLLESDPLHRELLCQYLRDLRTHEMAEPLSVRLARIAPQADQQIVAHVRSLAEREE